MKQAKKIFADDKTKIVGEAWHRQPNEPLKIYDAFNLWLNDTESERPRDTDTLAKRLNKNAQTVKTWHFVYDWENRAVRYDSFIRRQADFQKAEQAYRNTARAKQARKKLKTLEQELGEMLLEHGKAQLKRSQMLLQFPVVETRKQGSIYKKQDGTLDHAVTIIKPLPQRAGDAIKTLESGFKLLRSACDLPIDSDETNQAVSNDLTQLTEMQVGAFDSMTDEQIEAELNKLAEQERKLLGLELANEIKNSIDNTESDNFDSDENNGLTIDIEAI